jgi:hypothetical protein
MLNFIRGKPDRTEDRYSVDGWLGVVAGGGCAGWSTGARGPLLQDQVQPPLHGGTSHQGQERSRLGGTYPQEERDIVISSRPLEATAFQIENIRMAYVFYASGLAINVMYTIDDPKKRAVGFKLSEGMEVPAELAPRFKFATQKSKLAGVIRGSYFAFKRDSDRR